MRLMYRWVLIASVLLAAGCTELPTATPTRTLTGPTLAPSAVVRPFLPTELPPDFAAIGQNDPTAAALPNNAALPPLFEGTMLPGGVLQTIEITTEGGAQLAGDLYQNGVNRLPGVILLSASRADWGSFPEQLQTAGFTVLVMDLGDRSSVIDFESILQSFIQTATVDPGRIGFAGALGGADLALTGCAADLLCDAVALLSPTASDTLPGAMATYNPRPLLIAASEDDAVSFALVQTLDAEATGEHQLQPFTSAGRGADLLLNRPDFADLLITWLQRHLAN